MPDTPSPDTNPLTTDAPAAVYLQAKKDEVLDESKPVKIGRFTPSRRRILIVVVVIALLVAVNVGAVILIGKYQSANKSRQGLGAVSIDQDQLEKLGTNHGANGQGDDVLVVSPNAHFSGNVTIDKDFKLTGTLTAADASLAGLQAGKTSLTELNVKDSTSLDRLGLRSDLTVAGTTRLQGAVTIDKLLTATALNVVGDLNVGGTFSAGNITARSLSSTSTLTIAGHVITGGSAPSISGGSVGSGGTVSISGNDSAGTIAINTGSGPSAGILASISFRTAFKNIPRVVISPVGSPTGSLNFYVNRNANGFSIGSGNTPVAASGYVFDYIVMQ